MHIPHIIKTASFHWIVAGLLVTFLWGAVLLKSINPELEKPIRETDRSFFPMVLPTVLAPVIREEVHKNRGQDESKIVLRIKLPGFRDLVRF